MKAQHKGDPLLHVATVDLSQGTLKNDAGPCPGANHYLHKIPRGDCAFRQQSTPLMGNCDGDQDLVPRNPDGSFPPPYDSDWSARVHGMTGLGDQVHPQESPRHGVLVKREAPLPDLPVYFELDPHNTNTKDMMANSAHAMALMCTRQTDPELENRYSA